MEKTTLRKEIESRLTAEDGILIINNATMIDKQLIRMALHETRCGKRVNDNEFDLYNLEYQRNINLNGNVRTLLITGLDNVICDTGSYIEAIENKADYDEEDQINETEYIDLDKLQEINDYAYELFEIIRQAQIDL